VNLGGGYLLSELDEPGTFGDAVQRLIREYRVQVFVEPGAALVRNAGYILSTVVDVFVSDGSTVVLLDTSVNHMPEAFEYQDTPPVRGSSPVGEHVYTLAGCTCLAGDEFGEVRISEPLSIGSLVAFTACGAYTYSRANTFNGVPLPAVYRRTNGQFVAVAGERADFLVQSGDISDVGV